MKHGRQVARPASREQTFSSVDSALSAVKTPPSMFEDHLQKSLADLDARHLRRSLRVSGLPTGPLVRFADRALHNFASNDYLGLAAHPDVIAAALEATRQVGAGVASEGSPRFSMKSIFPSPL